MLRGEMTEIYKIMRGTDEADSKNIFLMTEVSKSAEKIYENVSRTWGSWGKVGQAKKLFLEAQEVEG